MRGSRSRARARPARRRRSRRGRSDRRGLSSAEERAVAGAAHRRDVARTLGIVAQLVAKPADVDVDGPVEYLGLALSIKGVQQGLSRDDSARGADERDEQVQL